MKSLLKILLGGFVLFMILAIADEWSFFAAAWFGSEESAEIELSEGDRGAAIESVELMLDLTRHLYMSGGDARFGERMPVSDQLLEEMRVDIDYLLSNQRLQDPQLRKLEVLEVSPLAEDRVEIRTREFWQHRFLWLDGSGEADPAEWQILFVRYLVARDASGWRVQGWEIDTTTVPSREATEAALEVSGG